METIVNLENTKNEVLRKIGRNMLRFQEVEHLLKFIIANGNIEGYVSEIQAKQKNQVASVQKQTMGTLVGKFIENTHSESDENTEGTQDLKEAYVSFNFRVDADAAYYETKKESLASIVNDRNDLIHHLLPRLNNSIESWLDTAQYLDRQHEKLIPEINALKSLIDHFHESKKIYFSFLNSDEGEEAV